MDWTYAGKVLDLSLATALLEVSLKIGVEDRSQQHWHFFQRRVGGSIIANNHLASMDSILKHGLIGRIQSAGICSWICHEGTCYMVPHCRRSQHHMHAANSSERMEDEPQ